MKHKRNFIYTYIYPSDSHNYGYLEVTGFNLSDKGMKLALEKGYAPAVRNYQSFDEFLNEAKDF